MRRSLIEFRSKSFYSLLLCRLLSFTTQNDNNRCLSRKALMIYIQLVPRRREDIREKTSIPVGKQTGPHTCLETPACTRQLRRTARWGDYRQPGAHR